MQKGIQNETQKEMRVDMQRGIRMQDKTVLMFDLDGTLTDPGVGITKSVRYALDFFGIHTENLNDHYRFIGPPLVQSFMKYYGFCEEQAQIGVEKYREYFRDIGIFENEPYHGIDGLLDRLSKTGRQLLVATSKPKVFADRILEHFNLMRYFDVVCGSELDGTRVNKGEVIRYALDKADIADLSKVIMVGDRKHDVIGAKESRIESIGVLYGYGSYEELHKAGATLIVETVEELGKALIGQ